MRPAAALQQRAELLRRMAGTFNSPLIKEDLLRLAARCDRLIANISQEFGAQPTCPIAAIGKKGSG